ncbi:MAG TPA: polysaccharide biosynthesis C-terminal domain-containing protein, partial [Gammaproteobacteria bacterium]|nr:polysaccharide biosynthesis C-terminal domain-containing protein [Gammaproteobacteria bacterium]
TTTVIQVLAISSPLGLLGYAIVPCLKGLGLPSRVSLLQILNSGMSLALVWLLVRDYDLPGAVSGILVATLLSQPLAVVFTKQLLKQPYAGLWRPLLTVTLVSLLGALLTRWLEHLLPGRGGFVMACAVGGILTFALIFIADRALNLGLLYSIARHFPKIALFLRIETGENPQAAVSKTGKESI